MAAFISLGATPFATNSAQSARCQSRSRPLSAFSAKFPAQRLQAAPKLVPLLDNVVIEKNKNTQKTEAGVFLPEDANDRANEGTVVAVGPTDPKEPKVDITVGDRVVFPEFGGRQIKLGDVEYLIFHTRDLLAKIIN